MTSFGRNVLTLGSGNVIAQAISLASVPVITRLYSPEQYGIFAAFLAVVTVLFPVSGLRFHAALMLPRSQVEADNLFILSVLSVVGFSGIVLILIGTVLFGGGVLDGPVLGGYVWLVPFGIAILGLTQAVSFWALRKRQFGTMASGIVSESIVDRGVVITLGMLPGAGAGSLITGRIVGPLVRAVWLMKKTVYPCVPEIQKAVSIKEMKRLAVRYRRFPLVSNWAFLLSAASREAPVLLLGWMFSPAVAGMYALGVRVLNLPMLMVGDAVGKAYLQKASSDYANGKGLKENMLRLFGCMMYLALVPAVVVIFFGPELFSFVFGANWTEAGVYTQMLALVFAAGLVYRLLSTLFDVYERHRQRVIFDAGLFGARTGALLAIAVYGGSPYSALGAVAISTCAVYLAAFAYLFSLVAITGRELAALITRKLAVLAPLVSAFWLAGEQARTDAVFLIGSIVLIVMAELVLIVIAEPRLRTKAIKELRRVATKWKPTSERL